MDLKTHIGWRNHVTSISELSVSHAGGDGSSSVISTLPLANLLTPQLSQVCRIQWEANGRAVLRFERANLPQKGMVGLMGVANSNTGEKVIDWRVKVFNGSTVLADSTLRETGFSVWVEHIVFCWDLAEPEHEEEIPDAIEIWLSDGYNETAFFDAGYLFVGDRWSPEDQASDGWSELPIDYSQVDETPSGQFYPSLRSTARVVRLVWDALSGLDMYGRRAPNTGDRRASFVDLMMAHCGIARPVIAIPFEETVAYRPWARPVYGRFVELQPWVKLPADNFAWSCSIKEHF